jgi:hypothetical protein
MLAREAIMRNVLLVLFVVCSLVLISCQAPTPGEETPEAPEEESSTEVPTATVSSSTSTELPVVEEEEPTATATLAPTNTASPTSLPTDTATPTITPTPESPGYTDELADLIDCNSRELITGTQVTTTDILTGTFIITGTNGIFTLSTAGIDIQQEAADASAVVQGGINIYNPNFPVPPEPAPQANEVYLFVFIPSLNQITTQQLLFRDGAFQPTNPPQFQFAMEGNTLTFALPAELRPPDGLWSAFTLWDTGTLQCDELGFANNAPQLPLESQQ